MAETRQSSGATDSGAGGTAAYRRVLLKLSGEALMGEKSFGLDGDVLGVDRRRDP